MPIFAAIGAVAGIAGGILGATQASEQNAQAQDNYRAQQRAAQEAADAQNEYNKKVFAADKANYYSQRQYEWDTAIQNWQYNRDIQEYQFLQTARQYLSSVENTQQQLTYNSVAAREAKEQEQASLTEILNSAAFQQEGLLIDRLQSEGQAAVLQAGKSRAKAMQTTVAEQGRNSAIISSSLLSAGQQSLRNMRDIEMSRYVDDIKARNAMMIAPERTTEIPRPLELPERIFVEPMKATAAFVPAPMQQSIFAPLLSGLAGGLSSGANIYGNLKK